MNFNDILKAAIDDAAAWETEMTEHEKSEIPLRQAKAKVLSRIYDRHKVTEVHVHGDISMSNTENKPVPKNYKCEIGTCTSWCGHCFE